MTFCVYVGLFDRNKHFVELNRLLRKKTKQKKNKKHFCQICGEKTVELLANGNHLNEISYAHKKRLTPADVTSRVNWVTRIDFLA